MKVIIYIIGYFILGTTYLHAQVLYKSTIINGKDKGYPLIIKIYKDKLDNMNFCLYDKQNYLYSTSGVGNSNLLDTSSNKFIYEIEFINNGYKEYIIETYDVSSTFGANTFFIIWFDGYIWKIEKSPFEKATIVKKGNLARIREETKSSHRIFSYRKNQFIVSDN